MRGGGDEWWCKAETMLVCGGRGGMQHSAFSQRWRLRGNWQRQEVETKGNLKRRILHRTFSRDGGGGIHYLVDVVHEMPSAFEDGAGVLAAECHVQTLMELFEYSVFRIASKNGLSVGNFRKDF